MIDLYLSTIDYIRKDYPGRSRGYRETDTVLIWAEDSSELLQMHLAALREVHEGWTIEWTSFKAKKAIGASPFSITASQAEAADQTNQ